MLKVWKYCFSLKFSDIFSYVLCYAASLCCSDLIVAIKDMEEDINAQHVQNEGISKKDADRRVHLVEHHANFLISFGFTIIVNIFSFTQISPASTLESSFEALNVKKFDG